MKNKILTTLGAPLDVTKSTLPAISQNYPSFAHLLHQSLLSGTEYSINTPHFEKGHYQPRARKQDLATKI